MELWQLRTFCEIAESLNFTKAAEKLNLTQSAVSQRVLKLEAHVGQRLFIRQGHGVRLTGAGELLMETAVDTLKRLGFGDCTVKEWFSGLLRDYRAVKGSM